MNEEDKEENRNGNQFKKRVLTMTPFADNSCGVGTFATSLNEQLRKRGNDVHVLEHRPWRGKEKYVFKGEGKTVSFETPDQVRNYMEKNGLNYDVIHSHNQVFSNMKNESLFNYFKDTPTLTQVHCNVPYAMEAQGKGSPHGGEEVQRQNRMFARSDKVINLTEDLDKISREKYGVEHPQNSDVVYNFANRREVDKNKVKKLRKKLAPHNEKLLLYSGRMAEEKGIKELFRGFKKAKEQDPSLKLVICGPEPKSKKKRKEFKTARKDLTEGKDYEMMGKLKPEKLPEYYSAADFFIQPSKYEHFSVSMIEAMAYNTPVITSNLPSIKSTMKLNEGKDSRYAIPINELNSPKGIKKSILEATSMDKSSLEKMVERANSFYENELTPDKVAEQYESHYDEIISNKKEEKNFDHSYVVPFSQQSEAKVYKTLRSFFENDDGKSQIILSPYGGKNAPERLKERFKNEIDSGKVKFLNSDERITAYRSNALNKGVSESTKSGSNYVSVIMPGDEIEEPHSNRFSEFDKNTHMTYNRKIDNLISYNGFYSKGKSKKITGSNNKSNLARKLEDEGKNPIDLSGTMYDKKVFDKAGNFYDSLPFAEDMDFYQKILNTGINSPIKESKSTKKAAA